MCEKMKKTLISVVELKKQLKDEAISRDEFRREIVDMFSSRLEDFSVSDVIGRGSFSTVLRVRNKKSERRFAMKIVLDDDIGPKEREWRDLSYKYLLPVLDSAHVPEFDLSWFLSPVVDRTLEDVIKNQIFKDNMAFTRAIFWLEEIISALNYLHKKELCFLNLKLSNVMICKDITIKLFGFHYLNKTGIFTYGYDFPDQFRPPESYTVKNLSLDLIT